MISCDQYPLKIISVFTYPADFAAVAVDEVGVAEGAGPSSPATWAASWEEAVGTSYEEEEDGAELEGSLALPPFQELHQPEEGVFLHEGEVLQEGETPGHYSVVSSSEGESVSYEREQHGLGHPFGTWGSSVDSETILVGS